MSLDRIIIHWTAGSYKVNSIDKAHYHYIVDAQGVVHSGDFKPEDNLNCADGKYAPHSHKYNTGSIGVSLAAMAGFKNKNQVGPYPITRAQIESLFELVAQLCKKYDIPIMGHTVLTHYELGLRMPGTLNAGKIDIVYMPPFPDIPQHEVGDFIRNKVRWYYEKLKD